MKRHSCWCSCNQLHLFGQVSCLEAFEYQDDSERICTTFLTISGTLVDIIWMVQIHLSFLSCPNFPGVHMPQPLLVFLSPFFSSSTFACFPACFGVVLRSKLFSFLFLFLFSRLDRFNFLMNLVRHGLVLVSLFACEPSVLKLCKYGLQGLGTLFQQLSLLVLHLTPLYSRRIRRKPSVRLVFFPLPSRSLWTWSRLALLGRTIRILHPWAVQRQWEVLAPHLMCKEMRFFQIWVGRNCWD